QSSARHLVTRIRPSTRPFRRMTRRRVRNFLTVFLKDWMRRSVRRLRRSPSNNTRRIWPRRKPRRLRPRPSRFEAKLGAATVPPHFLFAAISQGLRVWLWLAQRTERVKSGDQKPCRMRYQPSGDAQIYLNGGFG